MSLKLPTIVETYIKYSIPNRITSDLLLKMLTWYINGGGGGTGGDGEPSGPVNSIQYNAGGSEFGGNSEFTYDPITKEMTLGGVVYKNQLTSLNINNDQNTPASLLVLPPTFKFYTIEYSIERGNQTRVGTLKICHNNLVASVIDVSCDTEGVGISNSSIKFNAILSGNLILQYTSDDTGFNGIFKYSLIKW